jgi:uncharacterized Zn-binding protein involved in type VI secretion
MPGQGRLGDKAAIPADSHGCPGCPHLAMGPAVSGSPNVFINGRPALRVDDTGIHAACCGNNQWTAETGSQTVFINGMNCHRIGDFTSHCGGKGQLIEGSTDVIVGGPSTAGAAASLGLPPLPLPAMPVGLGMVDALGMVSLLGDAVSMAATLGRMAGLASRLLGAVDVAAQAVTTAADVAAGGVLLSEGDSLGAMLSFAFGALDGAGFIGEAALLTKEAGQASRLSKASAAAEAEADGERSATRQADILREASEKGTPLVELCRRGAK